MPRTIEQGSIIHADSVPAPPQPSSGPKVYQESGYGEGGYGLGGYGGTSSTGGGGGSGALLLIGLVGLGAIVLAGSDDE